MILAAALACDPVQDSPPAASEATEATRRPTPADLARASFPSVLLLTMLDGQGQPLSLGSAFVISRDIAVTNYHVVSGSRSGVAKRVGVDESLPIQGLLAADPGRDLALLEIRGVADSLPLGSSLMPAIGDPVFAIGNPQGLEGTFSQGIVSGIRATGADTLIQITAPISPGSSGGPVLDGDGRVVGVATATLNAGQNLNFAVPSNYITSLLEERTSGGSFPTSEGTQGARWSDLFGDPPTSAIVGESLTWTTPLAQNGAFSFSLRNTLNQPVAGVLGLVIFHDRAGRPIETFPLVFDDIIPPGLARRISGSVHPSVKDLTTDQDRFGLMYELSPSTKIEVRVLAFRVSQS